MILWGPLRCTQGSPVPWTRNVPITLGAGGIVAVAGGALSLFSSGRDEASSDDASYRDTRLLRCVLPKRRGS